MTNTYKELLMQREALEEAISKARAHEISEAKTRVRELVIEFGLTIQDVFPSGRTSVKTGSKPASVNKVAPKFREPLTGQTWTGRGKAPKWIQGHDRSKFLIV
jgi:DNA-binding protein H-NS